MTIPVMKLVSVFHGQPNLQLIYYIAEYKPFPLSKVKVLVILLIIHFVVASCSNIICFNHGGERAKGISKAQPVVLVKLSQGGSGVYCK